jgi:KipI family sensor histidine kinase inhibitor
MEIRPVGPAAALVELASAGEVRAAYRRLADVTNLVDLVPAARTVLVVADRRDPGALAYEIGLLLEGLEPPDAPDGPLVELEVAYDGPDLAEVARLTGLDGDEVVRRHAAAEYAVAFCGFAPGFAYLTGLPPELHVPRRATPRTAVEPGSVGLAGEFTGAYPRRSPGGWQLIGRTEAALWDTDRDPPALLAPGTRVRFRPC